MSRKNNEKVDNLNELLSIMKKELGVNIYDSTYISKEDFILKKIDIEDDRYNEFHIPFETAIRLIMNDNL